MRYSAITFLFCCLLVSCGPVTKFQQIHQGVITPKPENYPVLIVDDPPGKPYQLLGVLSSVGVENSSNIFMSDSKDKTTNALIERAREVGADAIVRPTTTSFKDYDVNKYGISTTRTHLVTAYAIRWATSEDPTFIPGTTTIASIIELGEEIHAKQQGKIARSQISKLEYGKSTKNDIIKVFGEPHLKIERDMRFKKEQWTYSLKIYDSSKDHITGTLQLWFDENGVLDFKLLSEF